MGKKKSRSSGSVSGKGSHELELLKALVTLQNDIAEDQSGKGEKADGSGDNVSSRFGKSRNPVRREGTEEDDQVFKAYYDNGTLLEPYWRPHICYRIFEESDVLQAGGRTYVDNIERPHTFETPKRYANEAGTKEALAELTKLEDFFSAINEKHSWLTVRKKIRFDRFVCGNGYAEVLRDADTQEPDLIYWLSAVWMRITPLDKDPTLTFTFLPRNGKLRPTAIYRRFRRFARAIPGNPIIYFKEFGDPRIVDRDTGAYVTDDQGRCLHEPAPYPNKATEIWWFRDAVGGEPYGVPPWVACMADIRGRYLSSWVNYDTLDHGGMPPWLLLVYGRLSKGTRKYLLKLIDKWRDPKAYSDPGVIEIEPNLLSFNTSGGAKAGAEFQSMRDMRSEESMFPGYRRETRETVAMVLRIPQLLFGVIDGAGGANYAALEVAENQVFSPIRSAGDERYNVELIQNGFNIYRWVIKTKPAPIGDKEQLYKALGMAGRTGGPSLNQLTEMENEVFGTHWPVREHWFYSRISAAEAIGMVRNGQVYYDEKTGAPVVLPPPDSVQGKAGMNSGPDNNSGSINLADLGMAGKSDVELLQDGYSMADATLIREAFKRIQNQADNWQPADAGALGFEM